MAKVIGFKLFKNKQYLDRGGDMESTINSQAYVFLTTFYGGIIIGLTYDIYRIFRYFFKPKKVATFIEDLVFWIIVSLIAVFILIFSNWGELRGYIFIGFILGTLLYNKLLSKIVISVLVHLTKLVVDGIKWVINIVLYPIKLLFKILSSPYKKGKRKIRKGYNRVKRKAKLPFRMFDDIKKHTKNILFKK